MKAEGVRPTVITYSALISACEKGGQWKLALEVLEDMKTAGHGVNVIAYSATISALSKGQQWEIALQLFRQIEESGQTPRYIIASKLFCIGFYLICMYVSKNISSYILFSGQ
jgi:pentatricopeptide repeat domain-containing protein 1